MIDAAPIEHFPALTDAGVRAAFIGRAPVIDVSVDRAEALARLDACHRHALADLRLAERKLVRADQVHGNSVFALAPGDPVPDEPAPGADALVTNRTDIALGIYVADCCAVYFSGGGVIGLAHSGRKGTELGIVAATVAVMRDKFGARAEDIVAQLSPCIRPPHYEVDFAATILAQCREAGVSRVHDNGACTAADPKKYYSYRREKGRTGRMLALLAL